MNVLGITLLIVGFILYTCVLIFLTHKFSYNRGYSAGFRVRRKEQRKRIKPIPQAVAELENDIQTYRPETVNIVSVRRNNNYVE